MNVFQNLMTNCVLFMCIIGYADDVSNEGVFSLLSYLADENENEEEPPTDDNVFTPRVVRRQLAQLASETQQPQTADPLTWWRENEARFHGLKRLARKYLAIPATSAPSERVFSLAGNICSRRRASLSPDHLDALVFLNANGDLIRE